MGAGRERHVQLPDLSTASSEIIFFISELFSFRKRARKAAFFLSQKISSSMGRYKLVRR